MAVKIAPYRRGSRSVRALADALGARILSSIPAQSRYHYQEGDTVINWGSTDPNWLWNVNGAYVLNPPALVATTVNKRNFFRYLSATDPSLVPDLVPFTADLDVASSWYDNGSKVVGRILLASSGGNGIILFDPEDRTAPSPRVYSRRTRLRPVKLYTKYMPKREEFRIHVVKGMDRDNPEQYSIHFRQRKARRNNVPDAEVNWQIRNHTNGFIFANQNVEVPTSVELVALRVARNLGLNFCAIDIGYQVSADKPWVYEVNTAPGLEGTTLERYVEFFQRVM